MVADTLASASITALDTTPVLRPDTGEGAPGMVKSISDFVTPTTGGLVSTLSLYKMVRIPSTAKLKALSLTTSAALDSGSPALAIDVGAYYSDAPGNNVNDGTNSANSGVLISATAFASAQLAAAKQNHADILSNYAPSKRNKPLWSALGLASDPGGFIDVVIAVHTAASTAVSAEMGVDAHFVM